MSALKIEGFSFINRLNGSLIAVGFSIGYNGKMRYPLLLCAIVNVSLSVCCRGEGPGPASLSMNEVTSISQYGITWNFDRPYLAGKFVTGDWWVVGPVAVVSVSPTTGPAPADEPATDGKSIYGASALQDDKRVRNGSMVFLRDDSGEVDFDKQGYDSRINNFDPSLTAAYPIQLKAGQSLISTVSSESYKDGKLATPFMPSQVLPKLVGGLGSPELPLALETAAILTCLNAAPPADAFRPAYIGKSKKIYQTKEIRWDLLPKLAPVKSTPDWVAMSRAFERPWLDHMESWVIQFSGPGLNQPNYGGVFNNLTTTAALMLLLDVPREQKEKLMVEFLQLGIDLHGMAECGRNWFSDGGHWMGRKGPIYFSSILLGDPALRSFPTLDLATYRAHRKLQVLPTPGLAAPTTLFQEDLDIYYGKGAGGQSVLWQVVFHTRPRRPIFEMPFAEWNEDDLFTSKYYWTVGNWPGIALAALHLKAKEAWNHDAFFDHADWFMAPGQLRTDHKGKEVPTRNITASFVQEMWDAYRTTAPAQPSGKENLKWVWVDGKLSADGKKFSATKGRWEANPKPK